jgi:hypothetical protein
MKARAIIALLASAACLLGVAASAAPAMADFHIVQLEGGVYDAAGAPAGQAGGHPYLASTHFTLSSKDLYTPDGNLRDVTVDLPPGFVANPTATPTLCTPEQLTIRPQIHDCPISSQVGVAHFYWPDFGIDQSFLGMSPLDFPIFNVVPRPGAPATLSFVAQTIVGNIVPRLRSDGDYGISADTRSIGQFVPIAGADVELWGVPADPSHDPQRYCRGRNLTAPDGINPYGCATDAEPVPFITNPTNCSANPLATTFSFASWQDPTHPVSQTLTADKNGNPAAVTGCSDVPFTPAMDLSPSADSAETPSGLEVNLDVPDGGLLDPDALAQSHIKKAVVTLPEGMTINPSAAEGLSVCAPADYARESADSAPGAGCPNGSKIGSVEVETPLLEEHLKGSLFLAQQDDPGTPAHGAENPFDSLIALYIVVKSSDRGIVVKLPGKVEPDPQTGQLITSFDDLPQLPFKHFSLKFREGARAPLVTPPSCGAYSAQVQFTPWSAADPDNPAPGELRNLSPQFKVTRGLGGGPCPPGGAPPFKPGFEAGSINNNAGAYTPFEMRLSRADGEQDMTKFSADLPQGLTAKLAGVSKCSEAEIASARAKTGRQELSSPSCPANSLIGHVSAGAGVGSVLTYVPGKIYLAGPFGGAPLSAVVITPAVAGPFDVGTVVTREALRVDPDDAEVHVDGSLSDPIPHILAGIPLKVREIRVHVDRDNFILNPTSCDPTKIGATLFGGYLDLFSAADDAPVALSSRFQASNCAALGFKPKLRLRLKGGARRGDHPGLRAVLNGRPGDANIDRASLTLPRSAFLDQGHIRTICTRVQFAANACPSGSVYGYAKATTPLLDEPLRGPVYLRSSDHKLPDLIADLNGLVEIELAGRIDSIHGGIRNTFDVVPDAPVTEFVLTMKGGKKGLIVNSRNLCAKTNRAKARFVGQNGKPYDFRPIVRPDCGKALKGKGHAARRNATG